MSRVEEFVGKRTIEAANVYGEGQHLYNMWLDTDEPIVRCRDCRHFQSDECKCKYFVKPCTPDGAIVNRSILMLNVDPNGFCAWGERKDG